MCWKYMACTGITEMHLIIIKYQNNGRVYSFLIIFILLVLHPFNWNANEVQSLQRGDWWMWWSELLLAKHKI